MDMLTNTTQNLALNPIYSFDGKIMVQLPEVTKAEAIITNMAGQVVASHFINAVGLIELPVSVSSGIYVVSVKGQAGIVTRKVFVR